MRVPTFNTAQRAFDAIQQRLSKQAQLQDQLGTGQRVNRPGDDPLAAAQAELARSRLARLSQDQGAGQLAGSLLTTAEGALGQGVDLLQSVRDQLVAAGNGSYGASDRQALALQLRSARDQLLALANTADGAGGRVFAGQGGGAEPASGDAPQWTAPAGVQRIGEGGRYAATVDGRAAFMAVPQGNGVFTTASDPANTGTGWIDPGAVSDASQLTSQSYRVTIGGAPGALSYSVTNLATGAALVSGAPLPADGSLSIDGQRVTLGGTPAPGDGFALAPAGRQSVFQTLDDAIALLEDPNAPANAYAERLQRAQAGVDRALDGFSMLRSQVGGEMAKVDQAQAAGEQQQLAETNRRSQLQDLDYAQAISDLQNNQTALQAALQAYAQVGKVSLFQLLS